MAFVASLAAGLGGLLTLIAAVGLLRLPDPLTRLHGVTKASTLATVFLLTATIVLMPTVDVAVKALVAIAFQLITAPIAAHAIGRAAYRAGVVTNLRHDEMPGDEPWGDG